MKDSIIHAQKQIKRLCILLCFSFLPINTAYAAEIEAQEQRELWTGAIYSSTYQVGICIAPTGMLRGVLLIKVKSGDVDVYHFYGQKDAQGVLHATHHSGHHFTGTFPDDATVTGKVVFSNGFSTSVTGTRTHDAKLSATCRPLAE